MIEGMKKKEKVPPLTFPNGFVKSKEVLRILTLHSEQGADDEEGLTFKKPGIELGFVK